MSTVRAARSYLVRGPRRDQREAAAVLLVNEHGAVHHHLDESAERLITRLDAHRQDGGARA